MLWYACRRKHLAGKGALETSSKREVSFFFPLFLESKSSMSGSIHYARLHFYQQVLENGAYSGVKKIFHCSVNENKSSILFFLVGIKNSSDAYTTEGVVA